MPSTMPALFLFFLKIDSIDFSDRGGGLWVSVDQIPEGMRWTSLIESRRRVSWTAPFGPYAHWAHSSGEAFVVGSVFSPTLWVVPILCERLHRCSGGVFVLGWWLV